MRRRYVLTPSLESAVSYENPISGKKWEEFWATPESLYRFLSWFEAIQVISTERLIPNMFVQSTAAWQFMWCYPSIVSSCFFSSQGKTFFSFLPSTKQTQFGNAFAKLNILCIWAETAETIWASKWSFRTVHITNDTWRKYFEIVLQLILNKCKNVFNPTLPSIPRSEIENHYEQHEVVRNGTPSQELSVLGFRSHPNLGYRRFESSVEESSYRELYSLTVCPLYFSNFSSTWCL